MRFSTILSALALGALQVTASPMPTEGDTPSRTLDERQTAISDRPEWKSNTRFRDDTISVHNSYRKAHSAGNLSWNSTLATFAQRYLNSKGSGSNVCPPFAHSGGPYGENLAIGYGTPGASVKAWGQERELYDFNNPGFDSKTGHFTQVVWRKTTSVGCARKYCTSGPSIKGWYLACEYWPRGNVLRQFEDNVKRGTYRRDTDKRAIAFDEDGEQVEEEEPKINDDGEDSE